MEKFERPLSVIVLAAGIIASVLITESVAKKYGVKLGYANAMAEVDAMVQPIGWETIRKTKEACEAKWKTECVITGGYMPKTDAQP